jgi:hypothetical protein
MLLEHGADPNIADHLGTCGADAAVEWITLQGGQSLPAPICRARLAVTSLIERLLSRGANPNAMLEKTPPKISLDPGATLNFGKGATPLMRAARTNDVAAMRALVEWGADPWATLPDGTTVLMIAAGQGLGPPRGDGPRIRVPTGAGAGAIIAAATARSGPAISATNAASAPRARVDQRAIWCEASRTAARPSGEKQTGLTALDHSPGGQPGPRRWPVAPVSRPRGTPPSFVSSWMAPSQS